MAKTRIIDRHGKEIELEDGEIIPDQCGVRVSSFLMDSVQREIAASVSTRVVDGLGAPAGHRPGHAYLRDNDEAEAAAQASYAAHKKYLQDCWRTPSASVTNDRTSQQDRRKANVNDADAAQSYAEMVKRVENAWKTTA